MSGLSGDKNHSENEKVETNLGLHVLSSDEDERNAEPKVQTLLPICLQRAPSEPMEVELDRRSMCSDDSIATEICTENNIPMLDDDLLDLDDPPGDPVLMLTDSVNKTSVCPVGLDNQQTADTKIEDSNSQEELPDLDDPIPIRAESTEIETSNSRKELPDVHDPIPIRAVEGMEMAIVPWVKPTDLEIPVTNFNESFALDDTIISVRTDDENEGYERAVVPFVDLSVNENDNELELLSLSSDTDDDDVYDTGVLGLDQALVPDSLALRESRKRERSLDTAFSPTPSTSSMASPYISTNIRATPSTKRKKLKSSRSSFDFGWQTLKHSQEPSTAFPHGSGSSTYYDKNYSANKAGSTYNSSPFGFSGSTYDSRGFGSSPANHYRVFKAARAQSSPYGRRGARTRPVRQERRNIRQIYANYQLRAETRKAEKDESNRIRRVGERQKLYKNIFPSSKTHDGSLVLDFDTESKEMVIGIEWCIVKHLKIHQEEGIKFLYSNCFESVDEIKKTKEKDDKDEAVRGGGGCILAHCMGLGKTFQTVAFTHAVLSKKEITGIHTILILCPLSTVTNWYKEYQTWLAEIDVAKRPILHRLWEPARCLGDRVTVFKKWKEEGGIGIIHYDLFRNLVDPREDKNKIKGEDDDEKSTTKKKRDTKRTLIDEIHRKSIEEYLIDPGADLVICDEGHLLKNCDTKLSKALNRVATLRRVALTGTPLQNNLVEYHTMMQFVKPNLLGNRKEFKNRFVNPIRNGECKDSSPDDVLMMKRRAHVLHKKLEGCVQRLDHTVLKPYLQPKHEYCIFVRLTEKQKQLYQGYLDTEVTRKNSTLLAAKDKVLRLKLFFLHYSNLVKILAHPKILKWKKAEEEEDDLIDLNISEDEDEIEATKATASNGADELRKSKQKRKASSSKKSDNDMSSWRDQWWSVYFRDEHEMEDLAISGKLVALQEILKISESLGDKILVFSQWLTTLDLIEDLLQEWDDKALAEIENGQTNPLPGRWRMGREFFRIDGSVKTADRQLFCDAFNSTRPSNKSKLFLISTKAGGLGINLHGANRVVMFDASFNPSNDMQSVFRVYRLGQVKPCYIYRLVGQGSIEEKVYNRQVVKLSLASRVVDEHQIQRHFRLEDLDELYKFEPDEDTERPEPPILRDELLSRLLITHRGLIQSYLEHDSLLANIVEEKLSVEEQKAAEEEFNHVYDAKSTPNVAGSRSSNSFHCPPGCPCGNTNTSTSDMKFPVPNTTAANDTKIPVPSAADQSKTPSEDADSENSSFDLTAKSDDEQDNVENNNAYGKGAYEGEPSSLKDLAASTSTTPASDPKFFENFKKQFLKKVWSSTDKK